VAELLNEMLTAGVIFDYALFGAAAQMRYTEPVATLDADVLVGMASDSGLAILTPIYEFCRQRGFPAEGDAVRVGVWPVQFIPAFSSLTREAMKVADTADFEGVPLRVVSAEYLATIALETGRSKDVARILALLESGSVTRQGIETIAQKHGLAAAWRRFTMRFLDE
jgi:hypothetical protein